MRADRRTRSAAFTMVELVIVIVLLGILAVVGAPRFFDRSEFDERFFFDQTLGALRYAHKLAVVTGCETQVDFSASGYTLTQRSTCASGAFIQSVPHPGTGAASYTGTAPPAVTVSSSVDPIVFDALGRAKNGPTVSDASVSVGTRTIALEGETGFARAQ